MARLIADPQLVRVRSHHSRQRAEGFACQQAGHGDLLTGQPVRDQLPGRGGGPGVVDDRHVGRIQLQLSHRSYPTALTWCPLNLSGTTPTRSLR
jgi:hypothetical protein